MHYMNFIANMFLPNDLFFALHSPNPIPQEQVALQLHYKYLSRILFRDALHYSYIKFCFRNVECKSVIWVHS